MSERSWRSGLREDDTRLAQQFGGERRQEAAAVIFTVDDTGPRGQPATATSTRLSEKVGAFPRSAKAGELTAFTVLAERLSVRQ